MYAPKLLSDSFGWTRPVADPSTQGLDKPLVDRIGPTLAAVAEGIAARITITRGSRLRR